jgi:K+-transporting ATPase ATPase B chain
MGIRTVMITGDNPLTAAAIAAEAGVDDYIAEATPEDKLRAFAAEQAGGRWSRWSATAPTTRRRWRRPTSAWR